MPSPPPPTAVIFDLDGTLVQTRLASWEVFRGVSDRFGLGFTHPEEFFALFDGNLYASLRKVCRDDDHAAEVKQAMLESLGTSYAPWPVPGIADVVRRLASVATLAVMSSNATATIRRILSDHDLALCFSHVFGGDVSESKQQAIERFVADADFGPGRRCESIYDESATPSAHEPGRTVLITDTVGDVREARAAGIRVVGVAWGMHTAEDLSDAGAEFVALWPQEILTHLLGSEATRACVGSCALPRSMTPRTPSAMDRPEQPAATAEPAPTSCGSASDGSCCGRCARSPHQPETGAGAARVASEARVHRRQAAAATHAARPARPADAISDSARGRATASEVQAAVALICS